MRYDHRRALRGDPESDPPLVPEHVEGTVFFVRDRAWGFVAPGREEHPGICIAFNPDARYCSFLKGTDADGRRHRATVVLEPTAANGLYKPTAFELVPRPLPRRLVALMYRSPRLVGRVETLELELIRFEMKRLFGRDGVSRWRH